MKDEPKVCHFCEMADGDNWIVHHIDGDEHNNERDNLAWAHDYCNRSYHSANRVWTDESRNKMRELRLAGVIGARVGHKLTDETKRKIGLANQTIKPERVKELTAQGLTRSEIATEMGYHISTIRKWQKRLGIYKA